MCDRQNSGKLSHCLAVLLPSPTTHQYEPRTKSILPLRAQVISILMKVYLTRPHCAH